MARISSAQSSWDTKHSVSKEHYDWHKQDEPTMVEWFNFDIADIADMADIAKIVDIVEAARPNATGPKTSICFTNDLIVV